MKNDDWKQDLYRYRLTPAPPKKDDFQDYIDLYFAEKDEKYLSWFLHYYEPTLNTQMMTAVQEYSMRGHFVDMKQAAVFGILKALANYDISLGVPFLVYKEYYVKNEIDDYIRTMRTGYTVQSRMNTSCFRKAMALYNKYGKSDDETIAQIAAEIDRSTKITKELIAAGLRNMSYVDFYRKYADEDSESSAEDVTRDDTTDPAKMFFDEWRADSVFDRYEKLDIRERSMIADHLGFCRECHGIFEMGEDENGSPVKIVPAEKSIRRPCLAAHAFVARYCLPYRS
jgi:DNA-directed RNA polymerase specialized sigma subunit